MNSVRVGVVQYSPGSSRKENLDLVRSLLTEAGRSECDLVVLPEIFSAPFVQPDPDDSYFSYAEPIDGPSNSMVSDVSREFGMTVVSPIFEAASVGDVFFNSACVFNGGRLVSIYRKSHLPFSNGFPEKYYFRPGSEAPTAYSLDGSDLKLGLIICYERHFPELSRIAALQGANILAVPVACSSAPSRDVFVTELKAHAIANRFFVACSNRVGDERAKRYFGMSAIYGPDGRVIAEAGEASPVLIQADVDLEEVAEARRRLPFFRDRRPELYEQLTAAQGS